jgi:peptidoglycan/LPS O-acetylase OafA/YrhL
VFGRDWFGGGFIGVDIFFVISGYLITRIILEEIFKTGSFRVLNFYHRRARRILPMLFTVILVSFPFAWRYLLPNSFVEYSQSILSAIFFGSNFFFYFTSAEYGAADALLKPFLHTWSLGVEEQFYILFPILLVLLNKYLRRNFFVLLVVMLLLSLLFSEFMSTLNVTLNFYLPISRFWELLVGSLLAYIELKYGQVQNKISKNLIPVVGLFFIFYSILTFEKVTPHPSLTTLIPIFGSALIIAFSSKNDFVGKILSSKLFVGIGLISYSAYLWHFPIIAFSRLGGYTLDTYDKILLVLLTFGLSTVSYIYVEQPFRNNNVVSLRVMKATLVVFLVSTITINVFTIRSDGYPTRVSKVFRYIESLHGMKWGLKQNGEACFSRQKDFCEFKTNNVSTSSWVQLVGDSHLESLSRNLFERLSGEFNITDITTGGCWPLGFIIKSTGNGSLDKSPCRESYQRLRLKKVLSKYNSIIILGARLPIYLHNRTFDNGEGGVEKINDTEDFYKFESTLPGLSPEEAFLKAVIELLEKGHSIIFIYPIPEVGWDVPIKLYSHIPSSGDIENIKLMSNPLTTSFERYLERTKSSFELLDRIEHKNLHRVYPHKLVCDSQVSGRCVTHDENTILYSDDDHPSESFSALINEKVIEKIYEITRNTQQ